MDDANKKLVIFGRKVVLEAIEREEKFQKIYLQHGTSSLDIKSIDKFARKNHINISRIDKRKMDILTSGGLHQGVAALLGIKSILSQEEYIERMDQNPDFGNNNLFLYLDRIQDPQNFGALLRSAELFGVDAVFYSLKDSAPVSSTVIKASMGAAFILPIVGIKTPYNFLELLKKRGIEIIGSLKEKDISHPLSEITFNRNTCIIIGNEESGIKFSLRKLCDRFVYIPQSGQTESFNASVAGGIILYEVIRQKTTGKQTP